MCSPNKTTQTKRAKVIHILLKMVAFSVLVGVTHLPDHVITVIGVLPLFFSERIAAWMQIA